MHISCGRAFFALCAALIRLDQPVFSVIVLAPIPRLRHVARPFIEEAGVALNRAEIAAKANASVLRTADALADEIIGQDIDEES